MKILERIDRVSNTAFCLLYDRSKLIISQPYPYYQLRPRRFQLLSVDSILLVICQLQILGSTFNLFIEENQ